MERAQHGPSDRLFQLRRARLHLFLFCLLVLPALIGSLSAYLALFVAASFLPDGWAHRRLLKDEPIYPLIAIGIALIALAFALSARAPLDLRFVMNFVPILLAGAAYPALRAHAQPTDLRWVSIYALGGVSLSVLVGLFSLGVLRLERADALFQSNPLHYAQIAMMQGWLATAVLVTSSRRADRWFWLGPLLGLACALLADARGVVLAFPILALLALALLVRSGGVTARTLWWVGAAGVGVLAAAVVAFAGSSRMAGLFSSVEAVLSGQPIPDHSANQRFSMWLGAARAFFEAPLFGHGWAHRMQATLATLPSDRAASLARYRHLHSDPIDFAAGGGLIGIAGYLMLVLAPLVATFVLPATPARRYLVSLLCATVLLCGLSNAFLGYESQTYMFAFGLTLSLALTARGPSQNA